MIMHESWMRSLESAALNCHYLHHESCEVVTTRPSTSLAVALFRCELVATNERSLLSDGVEVEGEVVNSNDKNAYNIVCRRCSSLMIPADSVVLVDDVPRLLKKMSPGGRAELGSEDISLWWYSDNEYDFDTIGWQTIEGIKVLMCGDCEFGPIGLREAEDKIFYVAVERVEYEKDPSMRLP